MPALERSAAGIVGKRTRGHFVVSAGHLDWFSSCEIVESEIDGAAAIVTGTLCGIGDKDFAFRRGGVPEDFRDIPWAVGVMDQEAVSERFQFC